MWNVMGKEAQFTCAHKEKRNKTAIWHGSSSFPHSPLTRQRKRPRDLLSRSACTLVYISCLAEQPELWMYLCVCRSLEYLDCVHGLFSPFARRFDCAPGRRHRLDVTKGVAAPGGSRARDPDGNQIKVKGHCRT